jgi:hypothetical protein
MSSYLSKIYKNAIKAENEVVKASINEDKPSNWYYGEYTEGNCKYDCLTEGHVLIAFMFNTFILNKEIFETNGRVLNIAQLLDKTIELSYKPAQLVGTKNVDKDVYCILQTETGDEVFFNKKHQKYFTDDVEYRVTDSKSPIKIYNGDVFMGIIMPVYMRK